MRIDLNDITAVTVHYRTYDLLERAIVSFRQFYPKMMLIIIDNSGFNEDSEKVYKLAREDGHCNLFVGLEHYKHHGPGLDMGIHIAETPYIFCFDSDVVFRKSIVEILTRMCHKDFYAAGPSCYTSRRGRTLQKGEPHARLYIHPCAMLLNRAEYLKGPAFVRHGAPLIHAMNYIYDSEQTHKLIELHNWRDFIDHEFRGTVERHGWNIKFEKNRKWRPDWQ